MSRWRWWRITSRSSSGRIRRPLRRRRRRAARSSPGPITTAVSRWHRFPNSMREVILRGLDLAGRDGRRVAEPDDLRRALETPAADAGNSATAIAPADEISPELINVFERAYDEAAKRGDKEIDVHHLRVALGAPSPNGNGRRGVVAMTKRALGDLSILYKIFVRRSVMHPKFITDPFPMYRDLRRRGPVFRDPLA